MDSTIRTVCVTDWRDAEAMAMTAIGGESVTSGGLFRLIHDCAFF
jgi:hypothetical protein